MNNHASHLSFVDIKTTFTDKRHQRALLSAALVGLLAYAIFAFAFPIHNHSPRLPWIDSTHALARANWMAPINDWLFQYGADLPVFSPVLSIIFLILSGALVSLLINKKASPTVVFLGSAFVATFPFNLAIFYYTFVTPSFAIAHLYAVLAIVIGAMPGLRSWILAALLAFMAMATYQPAFTTICTVAVISILATLNWRDMNGEALNFSTIWKAHTLPLLSALGFGLFCYWLSTQLLDSSSYALDSKSLIEAMTSAPKVAAMAYGHLLITQPELLLTVKALLFMICIFGGFAFLTQQLRVSISRAVIGLTLLLCLPLATKALFFVSSHPGFFIYRYNPGLQYLYLFFALISLHKIDLTRYRWPGYAGRIILVFLIVRFVQADLVYQGLHLRGAQHDLAITNRILARVESLPTLDFDKEYRIFFYGALPQARKNWFETGDPMPSVIDFWPNRGGPNYHAIGAQHAYRSFPDYWTTGSAFSLLGAKIKMKPILSTFAETTEKVRKYLEIHPKGVWPAHNSIFILEDIIVVRLEE